MFLYYIIYSKESRTLQVRLFTRTPNTDIIATMKITTPTIIVLVGITGDLAKRKLLPAINSLREQNLLPDQFELVGVTRRDDSTLFKMDLGDENDYDRLKKHLEDIEKKWGMPAQRLFYLSVAPTVSLPIIELLGKVGLSNVPHTKLLLEKPFGTDLENAEDVLIAIDKHFLDSQVYRIDHYLAKNTVRALEHHTLQTKDLKRIEIVASEKIGIEDRGDFYEQTGALRDFIQSHLLEVAAMTLSPEHRLAALRQLFIPTQEPITDFVERGQYNGYRDAVNNPDSVVETKVSIGLVSLDPNLEGVSLILKTGKALDKKSTDITLFYKDDQEEVISLNDTENAYENVFKDAMRGDKKFFISSEEVLETWRILAPAQDAWRKSSDDLFFYEQGSSI